MSSIYPSLIAGHLLCLKNDIEQLEPYCAGFHLDVMDFHFVPNLTWGPAFINAIRKAAKKQLSVHLMVEYPEKYFDMLHLAAGDIISIHVESPSRLSFAELFSHIQARGWTPSLAINPHTPLEVLIALPVRLEHVLLMTVQPGFSGQRFLTFTLEKLKALAAFRTAHNLSFTIAVDGGITAALIPQLLQSGAQQLAIASAIFNNPHPVEQLKTLNVLAS
jgi:ribulose-phosphate 3-epimerase